MNKLIKQQLEDCALHIKTEDNQIHIFIPKTIQALKGTMRKGKEYIIVLSESVTNPSSNSTLASNWNRGIVPKHNKYIVEILDNMSKMIKVNGVAVEDMTDNFLGWLPYDGFEIEEEL